MRTTLDIDDDILSAAKELAKVEGRTAGQVISDLARRALTTAPGLPPGLSEQAVAYDADAWPTFPKRGGPPVTSEMVRKIEEELDIEDATPWDHETDAPRVFDAPRPRPSETS